MRSTVLGAVLCFTLLCCVAPAHSTGRIDPDGFLYHYRGQAQVIVLGSCFPQNTSFGGIEAQLNFSLVSVGGALGVGYTHLEYEVNAEKKKTNGGYTHLTLQWRPLQLIGYRLAYRYLDVHGDLGVLAGGLTEGGQRSLRASLFTGGGLDFAVPLRTLSIRRTLAERSRNLPDHGRLQLVINLWYRAHLKQRPKDALAHELLLGLGLRGVM
jgi:hypothetical protein